MDVRLWWLFSQIIMYELCSDTLSLQTFSMTASFSTMHIFLPPIAFKWESLLNVDMDVKYSLQPNDDAATVKRKIIKQVNLAVIPLNAKQFDISWEERPIKSAMIPMFLALAPSLYAQKVEHAFLILMNPTNNTSQYSATHNYLWLSQTWFDPSEKMENTRQQTKLFR